MTTIDNEQQQPSGHKLRTLFRMPTTAVFLSGFIPPLFGAFGSIAVALLFHYDLISNYDWQCGRARLPSLSRIINLPMERIFWQLFVLFHTPMRFIELLVGFYRYGRLMNREYQHVRFYQLARYAYFWVGIAEVVLLITLSIIGERENIQLHVIVFYAFGFTSIGFFFSNIICHRQSLYYLHPYGRISYYIKITVTIIYLMSVPVLFGSFMLYWKKCILWGYELFALCEYIGVVLNFAYHGCAYLDIKYKVVFCVKQIID